jgi:hypothetical protein
MFDAIKDVKTSESKIEYQLEELLKRADRNDELLTRVMGLLSEVLKKLDRR